MANDPPDIHTYVVPGISSDHCKRAMEEHAGQLGDATVDVDAKSVTVTQQDLLPHPGFTADCRFDPHTTSGDEANDTTSSRAITTDLLPRPWPTR